MSGRAHQGYAGHRQMPKVVRLAQPMTMPHERVGLYAVRVKKRLGILGGAAAMCSASVAMLLLTGGHSPWLLVPRVLLYLFACLSFTLAVIAGTGILVDEVKDRLPQSEERASGRPTNGQIQKSAHLNKLVRRQMRPTNRRALLVQVGASAALLTAGIIIGDEFFGHGHLVREYLYPTSTPMATPPPTTPP
jgi:hypothetical protein